ncbi:MAG: outer membrane beta-barrel domain-containing protein [Deltaproteobacteria bacterium]|nr:outer membrane beta-barrel domain-containing protein [Deltaproteobacteria bacterium]
MNRTTVAAAFLTAVVCLPPAAGAGDNERIHALQARTYPLALRHDITPWFAVTLNDHNTSHIGGGLSYAFHLNEGFALQLDGLFFSSKNSSYSDEMYQLQVSPVGATRMRMNYWGGMNLVWYPIYGKFDFLSLFVAHFNVYLLGGGGVVGTSFYNYYVGETEKIDSSLFAGSLGGGFQIFIIKYLDLKFEIRDILFTAHLPPGYNATPENSSATKNELMFMIGLGVLL